MTCEHSRRCNSRWHAEGQANVMDAMQIWFRRVGKNYSPIFSR